MDNNDRLYIQEAVNYNLSFPVTQLHTSIWLNLKTELCKTMSIISSKLSTVSLTSLRYETLLPVGSWKFIPFIRDLFF